MKTNLQAITNQSSSEVIKILETNNFYYEVKVNTDGTLLITYAGESKSIDNAGLLIHSMGGIDQVLARCKDYMLEEWETKLKTEQEKLKADRKAASIIDAEAHKIKAEAESVISWCDPKDENEKSGRYWINAYHGAGVYRLIVLDGKIKGAIYGGFHDCNRSLNTVVAGDLAFKRAIEEIIKEKLGTDKFQLLKAEGSGTSFFLRNPDDKKFLKTKEYEVPSAQGGMHLNIEIV